MRRRTVLARNSLPARLPVEKTLIAYLLLDRFGAPMWLWMTMIVLIACVWTFAINRIVTEDQITFNPWGK